jgi:CRP/FNR family cyclic AMP-dependent transcriptional regulator
VAASAFLNSCRCPGVGHSGTLLPRALPREKPAPGLQTAVAHEVDYPAATPVVREGDTGSELFIVVHGEVDVRSRARRLATLRGGNFFGEMAVITGSPRTATVTTGTPVHALVIAGRDFQKLLQDSPDIQFKVLQEVSRRLEERRSRQMPQRMRLRD